MAVWGSSSFWQRLRADGVRRPQIRSTTQKTVSHNPGAPRGRQDEQMAGLSFARADEVRRKLTADFTALGYDVSFEPSAVVLRRDGDATVLDLDPLIDGLRGDSSPQAVATWTESFVTVATAVADVRNLSTAEIYRNLRTVLMPRLPADGRPHFADHEYVVDPTDVEDARIIGEAAVAAVGADLLECFAFEVGEAVVPVNAASLADADADDAATLRRAGRANLQRALEATEIDVDYHSVVGEDFTAGAWALTSPSFYLSSAPLVFEKFLDQRLPQVDPSEGVLFAVPTPTMLLVRDVSEGEDLAHGLHVMAAGAAAIALGVDSGRRQPEAMVSPRVHLWRDGHVITVSDIDDEGNYLVTPDDYLIGRMEHEF
ncbi:hypothetical protein [Corynebacterium guangdongense]|uniref:Uncharacterized protein n=1 Tax=Corynebacterium guangdongense TaxID=1783348 RepID=A0ABU1ZVJ5_9CORY|nr:hypothetical protein [Corynebacterium guangdongense]MDR7328936.1 hypothetical protein [Corynebacterium guangdongense]WJZ17509.1 hypothetical protein CGUA_04615 [Corynebacterium guangdongense]